MTTHELDTLLDTELAAFQPWFTDRQKKRGFEGSPLMSVERGVLKAYLFYLVTKDDSSVVDAPQE